METRQDFEMTQCDSKETEPKILEEINIEEIFVDGICGVY